MIFWLTATPKIVLSLWTSELGRVCRQPDGILAIGLRSMLSLTYNNL